MEKRSLTPFETSTNEEAVQDASTDPAAQASRDLKAYAKRAASLFTLIPIATVIWLVIHPNLSGGPPNALPSFKSGPAESGLEGILKLPETIGNYIAWWCLLILGLLVVAALFFASRWLNGAIAILLNRYYSHVRPSMLWGSGFVISLIWLGILLMALQPFAL